MQHETDSTKGRLIAAALTLFQERGYPSVAVQDVVGAVGLTKGAFYYYLESKEELLYLIHDEFITYELEKAELLLALGLSPAETLRRLVSDLCESIQRYQAHVMVFFRDMHYLSGDKLSRIKAKRDRYESYFRAAITEGVSVGEFRADLDPRILTFALFGMCNWMYQWFRPDGAYGADQIARIFQEIFTEGVRGRAT